jgi:hypothetical protein
LHEREAVLRYGRSEEARKRQVEWDIRVYAQPGAGVVCGDVSRLSPYASHSAVGFSASRVQRTAAGTHSFWDPSSRINFIARRA